MSGTVSGGYFPVYPHHDSLPDPEIRTFVTNFYRVSDRPDQNELWASYFTKDAHIIMGNDEGRGEQEIRELRGRMWTVVQERKHTVIKVFPGRFEDPESSDVEKDKECEYMLFGKLDYKTKDGQEAMVPWAGHGVLRKVKDEDEKEEWKFAYYRVWVQR